MKRWYVAQTQPRKERLALEQLSNQAFETFCPMGRRARKIGKRRVITLEPFFPNYVFVRLDIGRERWRSVNGTIGVVRLVSFGAEPAPAPTGLVEHMQQLTGPDGELAFDDELGAGDEVRIVGGPLDALCGTLVTVAPKKRVTVLLELLSGATRVEVARNRLVPA